RNDLVDALDDRVVVEHPPTRRARPHADHPLRLRHLVVDMTQHRTHLLGHPAGDDHHVSLPRGCTEHLRAEARHVIPRRTRCHHLDRAARKPEQCRPQRAVPSPLDQLLDAGGDHAALHCRALLSSHSRQRDGAGVSAQSHRSAPLRQTYASPTSSVTMKMPISTMPNTLSWRTIVAQGNRKIDSTSKMMKSIAVT